MPKETTTDAPALTLAEARKQLPADRLRLYEARSLETQIDFFDSRIQDLDIFKISKSIGKDSEYAPYTKDLSVEDKQKFREHARKALKSKLDSFVSTYIQDMNIDREDPDHLIDKICNYDVHLVVKLKELGLSYSDLESFVRKIDDAVDRLRVRFKNRNDLLEKLDQKLGQN